MRSWRTAETVGYGSITTSMSSFSIAFFISTMRVWELGAWPQSTMARTLLGWSMFSASSRIPSIQRDTGMPVSFIRFLSLPSDPFIEANWPLSHSKSSPQTRDQCCHAPLERP